MEIRNTPIDGVYEIYPAVYNDARGYFLETYKKDFFKKNNLITDWVQDNQSFSMAGILRGLHFQKGEYAQAKLARVITGKVLDVCVDLRKGSPTFGRHHSLLLDGVQHNMLYMPGGFAHGFSVLEDAVFSYKCSNPYHRESEGGIIWDDRELNIDWIVAEPVLSEKDKLLPSLEEFYNKSGGGL